MPVCTIKSIKQFTKEYLTNNGNELTLLVMIIALVEIFIQAVSSFSSVLGLILTLLTITLPQGLVHASLQAVDDQEIIALDEASYGLKRIGKYFTTYLLYTLMMAVIFIIIGFVTAMFLYSREISVAATQDIIDSFSHVVTILVIAGSIALISYVYIATTYAMFPYFMETMGLKNIAALKRSRQFMKHKRWSLVKMYLSFYKELLLLFIAALLLLLILPNLANLAAILITLLGSYLIRRKWIIYKAMFFKNSGLDE